MVNNYWYECFITDTTEYCLLDDQNHIRATAPNIDGIVTARQKYGWGKIHKVKLEKNKLIIGEEI